MNENQNYSSNINNYYILLELVSEELSISVTDTINNETYEKKYDLNTIISENNLFSLFKSIKNIFSFLSKIIENKKVDIEKDNNILLFSIIVMNDTPICAKLKLIKKEDNNNIMFKKITNEIKELKTELNKKDEIIKKILKDNEELKNALKTLQLKYDERILKIEKELNNKFSNKNKNNIELIEYTKSDVCNKTELKTISNWICPYKKIYTKLIFSSIKNGDKIEDIQKIIEHKNNLLMIIKSTDGYKFGGYTSNGWEHYDKELKFWSAPDKHSFLFSLYKNKQYFFNSKNIDKTAVYFHNALVNFEGAFGFGWNDLIIGNNFLSSHSSLNKKGFYFDNTCFEGELNGGKDIFQINYLEVHQLIIE